MLLRGFGTAALALACAFTVVACSADGGSTGPDGDPNEPTDVGELTCDIDQSQIVDGGVGVGGIPALQDPQLVTPGASGTEYLSAPDAAGTANIRDHNRVIVFQLSDQWIAVPHNILWWHEVAHVTVDNHQLVATYCPLTGSSLVFDFGGRGISRFQVSGLLFNNNLIMRDPDTGSLWPQMLRAAACGDRRGEALPVVPSMETRWERWKELHPDTRVVSSRTGFDRDYNQYPYGQYEEPTARPLFEVELDPRRPIKERLLGIPVERGGVAYPFGELAADAGVRAVHDLVEGEPIVIFWDEGARTAVAYEPRVEGQGLEFQIRDGRIFDVATESTWRYDGFATDGPLEGARLPQVEEAYVAFWFAWAIFQPETRIWEASSGSGEES